MPRERPVLYEAERAFTKSVHVLDPDGNEIELYIDERGRGGGGGRGEDATSCRTS